MKSARLARCECGAGTRGTRNASLTELFYLAFGDADAYVIADLPDNVTAAAGAAAVGSTGAVSVSTTVLLTPAEVDEAFAKTVDYRPPGG